MAERLASVEEHRIRSHGVMVSAWRLGADPAVLLIHGWEDNHSLWSPLIDSLADRGRSLIALDMPAHGFSDGERGLNPEAIDAVLAVSTALGPVDAVVAHSSGAGVAAMAVMEGLAADRAVLIAPPLRGDDRFLRYAKRQGVPEDVAAAARAIYNERLGQDRAAMDLRAALPLLDVEPAVGPLHRRRTDALRRLSGGRGALPTRRILRGPWAGASQDRARPRGRDPYRRLRHDLDPERPRRFEPLGPGHVHPRCRSRRTPACDHDCS